MIVSLLQMHSVSGPANSDASENVKKGVFTSFGILPGTLRGCCRAALLIEDTPGHGVRFVPGLSNDPCTLSGGKIASKGYLSAKNTFRRHLTHPLPAPGWLIKLGLLLKTCSPQGYLYNKFQSYTSNFSIGRPFGNCSHQPKITISGSRPSRRACKLVI